MYLRNTNVVMISFSCSYLTVSLQDAQNFMGKRQMCRQIVTLGQTGIVCECETNVNDYGKQNHMIECNLKSKK
ncbi:hypothetical protein HUJ04_006105 [Dendroctonus ponderosae]|nr:hypothetical protein HUJ04_006105 [Dendroctonus ponderosae]KAH1012136.1 hypothetical protein HUJ05_011347 [Dendroctonus ponderosae]